MFKNDKIVPLGTLILTFNSENTIAETIKSAKKVSSQIVIIDSGSTDKTISIASSLGTEIYFRKWTNDFSAQRNYGLNFIKTDWVLMLDSDEVISKFDKTLFMDINKNPLYGGINLKIKNLLKNEQSSITHKYTRIFRKHKEIKFTGLIHEQIRPSIENLNLEIYDSDFEIIHYGYQNDNQDKYERNLQMLKEEQKNNQDDDYIKYHLANTYFSKGDLFNAEQKYLEVVNSPELSENQKDMTRIRLSQIYLQKNEFQFVLDYSDFASQDKNIDGLRNFIRSAAFLCLGEYDKAYNLLNDYNTINSELVSNELLTKSINSLKNFLQL